MASEHQVALTTSQRMLAPSSKTARQGVPAFPRKLYEMVNDPNNADLICWSEAGDSFFVLDHERLAHGVLGRWFKHRQFSSFVRQLNMYGFHKISHLQQGVLKSDTETEFWNFTHANFRRGQPDLLCLIQRKKQPQQGEDGAIDLRDPSSNAGPLDSAVHSTGGASTNSTQANGTLSNGQIPDVHSIVNAIAAIERHQMTIYAELNELKGSNQLLRQDVIAARERHQKQQDVINTIVKFLTGVFGNHGSTSGAWVFCPGSPNLSGRGSDGVGENLIVTPNTGRKMRLMIENAKRDGPKNSLVEELTEIPLDNVDEHDLGAIFQLLMAPSPAPPATMLDRITVIEAPAPSFRNSVSLIRDSTSSSSTSPATETQHPFQHPDQGKQISRSVASTTRHSPTSFEIDPRIHGVLNQLTPAQIQQLLTSLSAQPLLSDTNSSLTSTSSTSESNLNATNDGNNLLTQYTPPLFDFSVNSSTTSNNQLTFTDISQPMGSTDDLIPFDHDEYGPGASAPSYDNGANPHQTLEGRMERQWHAAEYIEKDVNALNSSISSLIQTFGPDPPLLAGANPGPTNNGQDIDADMQGMSEGGSTSAADFDFDSFLNHLSAGSGVSGMEMLADKPGSTRVDHNELVYTWFLDEAHTPSSEMTVSPMQPLRQVSPDISLGATSNDVNVSSAGLYPATKQLNSGVNLHNATAAGTKRKSEVDFEALTDAMDSQNVAAPTAMSTTPLVPNYPTTSKRRKGR